VLAAGCQSLAFCQSLRVGKRPRSPYARCIASTIRPRVQTRRDPLAGPEGVTPARLTAAGNEPKRATTALALGQRLGSAT
jgi:hypothetical protein